jgi:hypothetical protein
MNSETFKTNYMYSGRFKIGHRQISLANYSWTSFFVIYMYNECC